MGEWPQDAVLPSSSYKLPTADSSLLYLSQLDVNFACDFEKHMMLRFFSQIWRLPGHASSSPAIPYRLGVVSLMLGVLWHLNHAGLQEHPQEDQTMPSLSEPLRLKPQLSPNLLQVAVTHAWLCNPRAV